MISGAAVRRAGVIDSGEAPWVAASGTFGDPAGGRCDGLDNCLLPPLGRAPGPCNRTRVRSKLLLSRPSLQGAS